MMPRSSAQAAAKPDTATPRAKKNIGAMEAAWAEI